MMVSMRWFPVLLILCFSWNAWAGRVLEDGPLRFSYADSVVQAGGRACDGGWLWQPGHAVFPGDSSQVAMPFRVYTVALPGPVRPSFRVENVQTEVLQGELCRLGQAFPDARGQSRASRSAWAGEPYVRDGLWRSDIYVPLLISGGGDWVLRRSFRLVVEFASVAEGGNPGARALASVLNPQAAGRFGSSKALAKSQSASRLRSAALDGSVQWLLRFGTGDKNQAAFTGDGLYAVSFAELKTVLRSVGRESELDGIPVNALRLFGGSADTLSEVVGPLSELTSHLQEIPLQVVDSQNNGIFDDGDSLRFVGWGSSVWKRLQSPLQGDIPVHYYYSASPYSFHQVFYLGVGGSGQRLGALNSHTGSARDVSWMRYQRLEKDLFLRDAYFGDLEETTGKEWFWVWGNTGTSVKIPASEFSGMNSLPGLQGDSLWLGVSFIPPRSTAYNPLLSANSLDFRMRYVRFSGSFRGQALPDSAAGLLPGGTFLYPFSGVSSSGNSLSLELLPNTRQDRFDGVTFMYRWNPASAVSNEWLLPGDVPGRIRIPVSDGAQLVRFLNGIPQGWLTVVNGFAQDSIAAASDVRYLLLPSSQKARSPVFMEAMLPRRQGESEPLTVPTGTEYLIISPELLLSPALALRDFRESGQAVRSFRTAVVVAEDIYRDFGGGAYSPVALRNFLQYARARSPGLRWVLLAGDGHYDYRRIRPSSPVNLLPPYEREDMSTDDFFAILDSGETVSYGRYDLDLSIGRLPVNSVDEFSVYLRKIRQYEQTSLMDNDAWRNTLLLLADDAMQRDEVDPLNHTAQQERISMHIDSNALARNFSVDIRKLYLLDYERDASYQKPEAARDLLSLMNQGALFSFYFGHGSSTVWADEALLRVNSIYELDNGPRYTILGSFACTVGRFDESQVTSLSEIFLKTADRGAIASIGAMRETYSDPNEFLAQNLLYTAFFEPRATLGDAVKKGKNYGDGQYSFFRYNNEKYVLLGEPVLSMPIALLDVELDHSIDSLQALQKVNLGGSVSSESGKLRLQVIEGARSRIMSQDLGNGSFYSQNVIFPGNPIHSETMTFEKGHFETQFVTPRKIAFGDTAAQIRVWAWSPGESRVGRALLSDIVISGTSSYADSIQDQDPPSIQIYPCLKSGTAAPYADGQKVSLEIPACLEIVVEDSTGIDYREEADEGISFEVTGVLEPWHPWPYLEQSGRRAVARMQFGSRFSPGNYTFQVMAQDILGNIAYRSLAVELASESRQGLADVFNVPNPMGKKGTTFYFKDLSGDRRNQVTIQIFDQNGRLVQVLRNAQSGVTRWDGRDRHGRLLANGLYHYAVQNAVFPSESSGRRQVFTRKQKLVISR